MLVRDAIDADWPAMWRILQPGADRAEPDARADWFADPPGSTLVADDSGTVVGTGTLGPDGATRVVVDPAARGEGVGSFLGEVLAARARQA